MTSHAESKIKGDILVVDDIPENVRLLFEMLVKQGYEVRQTITGTQALQAIHHDPPDLILLDIMMPGMDGYQVCQRLKADPKTRGIPIIFLSAKHDPLDRIRAFQIGGADYISKPFQVEEILARVEHQVTLVRQQRQLRAQNIRLQREIEERKKIETILSDRQQFLHLAIDANPNLIYVKDSTGKFTLANRALTELYDTTVEHLLGKTEADLQSDRAKLPSRFKQKKAIEPEEKSLLKTQTIATEPLFDRKTRKIRWFQTTKTPFMSPDGETLVLGVAVDITERQRAEMALWRQAERERLLRTIAQRIRQSLEVEEILQQTVKEIQQFLEADRVFICRRESNLIYRVAVESVSTAWPSLQGVAIEDEWLSQIPQKWEKNGHLPFCTNVNGSSPALKDFLHQWQVCSQCIVPIFKSHLPKVPDTRTLWGAIVVHYCHSVREWQEGELEILSSLAVQVAIAVQQGELLDELEAANRELKNLANQDGLTGLANRRRFDEVLQKEWQRMQRDLAPLSLILADIDFFKRYNDTYGHQQGDECLKAVARVIRTCSKRSSDIAARYGGEEFAVILPNTPLEGAVQIARQIQEQVQKLQIEHSRSRIRPYVTISLGVACQFSHQTAILNDLIGAADAALYRAKASGRDRVEF